MRAAVLAEFKARSESVLSRTWDEMRRLEVYTTLGDDAAAEVLTSVRWVFATLTDCIARGQPLSAGEVAELERIGSSRARIGVPLHQLRLAFSAGVRHGSAALVAIGEELGASGMVGLIPEMVAELVALLTEASAAVERGFGRQARRLLPGEARRRSGFVEAVLGDSPSLRVETMAAELGLSGAGDRTLVLAVPGVGSQRSDLHAVVELVCRELPDAIAAPSFSVPWPHAVFLHVGVVGSAALGLLEEVAKPHNITFAVDSGPCWQALGARFRRVRPYVQVVGVIGGGRPRVVALDDVLAHEPLSTTSLETAEAFIRDALGPVMALPADDANRWLATFEALFEAGGGIRAAAKVLHVHEATLRKRLSGLPEGMALDPRRPQDGFKIGMALHLLRLHAGGLPPPGDPRWR